MGLNPTPTARGLVYPAGPPQTPRQQAMSRYESSKDVEPDFTKHSSGQYAELVGIK